MILKNSLPLLLCASLGIISTIAPHSAPPVTTIIVDDGDAAYTESGNWAASSLPGEGGDSRYSLDPAASAEWNFGPQVGSFSVSVTFPTHPNSTTDATLSVLSGSTLLGSSTLGNGNPKVTHSARES